MTTHEFITQMCSAKIRTAIMASLVIMIPISMIAISTASYANTSVIKTANNQIEVQYRSTYIDYTETGGAYGLPTGTLDTEKGWVPGIGVSMSVMRNILYRNDYVEIAYDYLNGHTNYVGASIFGGAYGSLVGTSSAKLTNYSLRLGEGFDVNNNVMLTPFLEIGHHKWDRGVNLGETYDHSYYGIGALGQYSVNDKLVLGADVMLGETFSSKISIVGAFNESLGNSFTYRLGASADYILAQNIHANLGADFTGFKYGAGALVPLGGVFYGFEPDSKTYYTTLKIGLGYAF